MHIKIRLFDSFTYRYLASNNLSPRGPHTDTDFYLSTVPFHFIGEGLTQAQNFLIKRHIRYVIEEEISW